MLRATTNFIKLPKTKMWLDYDKEADVLYLHFEEKPKSTHSEMRDDGIILDYRDDLLVGLTILKHLNDKFVTLSKLVKRDYTLFKRYHFMLKGK